MCADGTNMFKVPKRIASTGCINVVQQYKHVGSLITHDLNTTADARKNARAALAAFNPLSVKFFGSPKVPLYIKLWIANSLVFSLLFFQVEVWPSFSDTAAQVLNDVYMRVLRRVASACRYKKCMSDYDVRYHLYMPSIESKIRQMRLMYVGRLCRSHPPTLLSLLQSRPPSGTSPCVRSPWTEQVVTDMRKMKFFHSAL